MEWLNIHTSTLDSPEFVGAEPGERATWLCLLRYCIGQENGGVIRGCAGWNARKWLQLARVTDEETRARSELFAFEGEDLAVRFYPAESEESVRRRRAASRENGKLGRRPRKNPAETQVKPGGNPTETQRKPSLTPILFN
jgi:hypothetical protein